MSTPCPSTSRGVVPALAVCDVASRLSSGRTRLTCNVIWTTRPGSDDTGLCEAFNAIGFQPIPQLLLPKHRRDRTERCRSLSRSSRLPYRAKTSPAAW